MTRFRDFEMPRPPDTAAKRDRLRADMPMAAAVVDEFRAVFGDGVRVLLAEEGGKVVKSKYWRPDDPRKQVTPSQFLATSRADKEWRAALEDARKKRNGG